MARLPLTALQRKLLRDLWRTRAQVASIAAVLAGGVMTVVALRGTSSALEEACAAYYAEARFADIFATLTRAPDDMAARLAAIPGVARVDTRVIKDIRLDIPGLDRPGVGRLLALPPAGEPASGRLNVVRVLRGRAPVAQNEVLINGRFAESNRLAPGDSLGAVINERLTTLHVVGIGAAPDYLFEEAAGGMANDRRAFGILWAPHDLVADATGMRGAFNDVAIALAPHARAAAVIAAVDSLLARQGGRGAISRDDQLSNRVVKNELQQLAVMGFAFPAVFVAVAAFLAGTVVGRLIATERAQIAVLKAFGYSNGAVAWHYLAYAIASIAVGVVLGLAIGAWVGRLFTALYGDVLRVPGLRFHMDLRAISGALLILAVATLLGAVRSVRAAALLPPAQALREPAPARYRTLLLDRLGLGARLPASARMVLRGLERRPARALLGASGVAAALAMMAGALSLYDASRRMIEVQFRIGHRETLALGLVAPALRSARPAFAALPGVAGVELMRAMPVRLQHAGRSRTLLLTGLESGGELHRLVDVSGRTHGVPPDGVVLSAALGEALAVHAGDTVTVELLERLRTRRVMVAALLDEVMSPNAYMDLAALDQLDGEGPLMSGAYLHVAGEVPPALFAGLRDMPNVAGVTSRAAMLANFDEMMARSFRVTAMLVVIFASVIAIGVVYNGARIALSERGRELASLRVLGFTTREVGVLLLGEQALLTTAAVPLGFGLGWLFARYLVHAFESEQFRVPLVTRPGTYAFAALVVLTASAAAGALMYRRAAHLDLVAVLKTRE